MADIFLSYASEDRERVRPLVQILESEGWTVWWDRDIKPGDNFHRVIAEAIAQAKCVIVCWSEPSVKSDWVANEADEGKERGILVPILLDPVRPPLGFRLDHAVTLAGWTGGSSDPELQTLLETVTRHIVGKGPSVIDSAAEAVAAAESARPSATPSLTGRIGIAAFTLIVIAGLTAWIISDRHYDQPGDTRVEAIASRYAQSSVGDAIYVALNRPMVAVLPFTNASGDPNNDYVGLGVMDEIIVGLQQFQSFPVVSRNATIAFRKRSEPVHVIAAELDAAYILDGSVRRHGEQFRIVAALTDDSGAQVWARGFDLDADMSGIFPIIDELTAIVSRAVLESEVERVTSFTRPPINAWEHYVKGLSILLDWQPAHHAEGVQHVERALEIAPTMAEAWWALGEFESYRLMTQSRVDSAAAENVIGYFRKAHELSAFYGAACGCLGYWLTAIGRDREARVVFEQARQANPLSGALLVDYAQFLVWDGQYPQAIEMAEVSTRLGTDARDKAVAASVQATALLATDQPAAARMAVHKALLIRRLDILVTPSAIAILFALGDREDATALFKE
ncbi:MAG: TIR domain-containing protein, partial [Gammaproteobacteria bacterium]|nr:TIR domain-containing protein [Gammaproteobacteria bacterium]